MQMKELITELSIVEGEISRLEIQISHLQINLKQEQDETLKQASTSSSKRAWRTSESYNNDNITPHQAPILPKYHNLPPPSPMVMNKDMMKNENNNTKSSTSHHQENATTFETETLHFINKAIKDDYTAESFHKSNQKIKIVEKENHRSSVQQENKLQENINMKKKSRMMKLPSPLREPRYSSPKVRFYICFIK